MTTVWFDEPEEVHAVLEVLNATMDNPAGQHVYIDNLATIQADYRSNMAGYPYRRTPLKPYPNQVSS